MGITAVKDQALKTFELVEVNAAIYQQRVTQESIFVHRGWKSNAKEIKQHQREKNIQLYDSVKFRQYDFLPIPVSGDITYFSL